MFCRRDVSALKIHQDSHFSDGSRHIGLGTKLMNQFGLGSFCAAHFQTITFFPMIRFFKGLFH